MGTTTRHATLSLALGLSIFALAACDAEDTEPAPTNPGAEEPAPAEMRPTNQAAEVDEGTGAVTGINPRATEFADEISALGYDINRLPPLGDLVAELQAEPEKLHTLMESFSSSLGVRCSGCHTVMGENGRPDFAAATPEKNITTGMWNEFVVKLSFSDGSPLFCDSCHQGQLEFLDRTNTRELGAWMRTNFVQGLARRDSESNNCATCHGAPFQGEFLQNWAAVSP